jgi:hypothetical protein
MTCACSCWNCQCVLASYCWHLGTLASGTPVSSLILGGMGLSIIALLMSVFCFFCTLGSAMCNCVGGRVVLFGGFVPVSKVTVEVSTLGFGAILDLGHLSGVVHPWFRGLWLCFHLFGWIGEYFFEAFQLFNLV